MKNAKANCVPKEDTMYSLEIIDALTYPDFEKFILENKKLRF